MSYKIGLFYMVAILCSHLQGEPNAECRKNLIQCTRMKTKPIRDIEEREFHKRSQIREKCRIKFSKPEQAIPLLDCIDKESPIAITSSLVFLDEQDYVTECAKKQGIPGVELK